MINVSKNVTGLSFGYPVMMVKQISICFNEIFLSQLLTKKGLMNLPKWTFAEEEQSVGCEWFGLLRFGLKSSYIGMSLFSTIRFLTANYALEMIIKSLFTHAGKSFSSYCIISYISKTLLEFLKCVLKMSHEFV